MVKSKLAITSLVIAVLAIVPFSGWLLTWSETVSGSAFFFAPLLFSITGIVLSTSSLFLIKKYDLEGKGMAISSLVISLIILLAILFPVILFILFY